MEFVKREKGCLRVRQAGGGGEEGQGEQGGFRDVVEEYGQVGQDFLCSRLMLPMFEHVPTQGTYVSRYISRQYGFSNILASSVPLMPSRRAFQPLKKRQAL